MNSGHVHEALSYLARRLLAAAIGLCRLRHPAAECLFVRPTRLPSAPVPSLSQCLQISHYFGEGHREKTGWHSPLLISRNPGSD